MNWLIRRRHKKAIQKPILTVGPLLQERYGFKEQHYTIGQVTRTIEDAGIRPELCIYCFAVFLDEDHFDQVHRENGERVDYVAVRREIAEQCFTGEPNFTVRQAIRHSGSSGHVGWWPKFGAGEGGGDGD